MDLLLVSLTGPAALALVLGVYALYQRRVGVRYQSQFLRVAVVFMAQPDRAMTPWEIAIEGNMPSGTLYPTLALLESLHWIDSEWEALPPESSEPRRRYYKLTALGKEKLTTVMGR